MLLKSARTPEPEPEPAPIPTPQPESAVSPPSQSTAGDFGTSGNPHYSGTTTGSSGISTPSPLPVKVEGVPTADFSSAALAAKDKMKKDKKFAP